MSNLSSPALPVPPAPTSAPDSAAPPAASGLRCHYCLRDDVEVKKCAMCKAVFYCSKDCQRADWKDGHKEHCKSKVAALEAVNEQFHPSKREARKLDKEVRQQVRENTNREDKDARNSKIAEGVQQLGLAESEIEVARSMWELTEAKRMGAGCLHGAPSSTPKIVDFVARMLAVRCEPIFNTIGSRHFGANPRNNNPGVLQLHQAMLPHLSAMTQEAVSALFSIAIDMALNKDAQCLTGTFRVALICEACVKARGGADAWWKQALEDCQHKHVLPVLRRVFGMDLNDPKDAPVKWHPSDNFYPQETVISYLKAWSELHTKEPGSIPCTCLAERNCTLCNNQNITWSERAYGQPLWAGKDLLGPFIMTGAEARSMGLTPASLSWMCEECREGVNARGMGERIVPVW